MSWEATKGIREGERQAKASERAKRRGAALARSGGSGKSRSGKSGFTRAQGRAAVGRGGRGIVIKSLKNGGSFKDILAYADDPAKSAKMVAGNCPDSKSALRTMLAASRLRPDIKNPVGHITLSLPPVVGKDEQRWTEIVNELREQIGLDESFPCIAFRHQDQAHDHAHFLFSRCSITGKVHDQRNIGLRCAAAEQKIEQKFNLHLVPRSEFKNSHISQAELEMGLRKGVQPPRMQIAAAIKVALLGNPKPSTAQFIERLNSANVGVRGNVASTGKMNGFSFTYDGISFTASKISKEFGWKSLSTKIDFDLVRDAELLRNLDGGLGTASRDLALANRAVSELSDAVASVSTEKGVGHEQQNRDAAQTAGINNGTGATDGSHAKSVTTAGGRDHELARVATPAHDTTAIGADPAPVVDRTGQLLDQPKQEADGCIAEPDRQPNRRPSVLSVRTDGGGRVPVAAGRDATTKAASIRPVQSVPSQPAITSPDLRTERWARSARLLDEYRRGIKTQIDIAELDRAAVAVGHDPADIISAHATSVDKLPGEIIHDVLKNAPSQQMREYIEKEFTAAKKRSEARQLTEKVSDIEATSFRPK